MTSSKLKSSYSPLLPPLSTTIQSEINSIIITTPQLLPTHANEFHKLCRTKKNNHHTATSPSSQSAFLSLSSSPPQPTPPPAAFSFFYNPLRTCGLSVRGYSVPQRDSFVSSTAGRVFWPNTLHPSAASHRGQQLRILPPHAWLIPNTSHKPIRPYNYRGKSQNNKARRWFFCNWFAARKIMLLTMKTRQTCFLLPRRKWCSAQSHNTLQ